MAYFPDLATYAYGHSPHPGVVHVGRLDGTHPFSKGKVDPAAIEKLRRLAHEPVELYRGYHYCELCTEPPDCAWAKWSRQRASNGEIRIAGKGVIFAAPLLIIHNIEQHGYLPPLEFLNALEDVVG